MIERSAEPASRESETSSATALYNAGRLRTDTWNQLRDFARRLRRLEHADEERTRLEQDCRSAFERLAPIEQFCVFPGAQAFAQIRQTFEDEDYEVLSQQVVRIVRLMSGSAYRRLDLSSSRLESYADLLDVSALSEAVHSQLAGEQRPYFEVLVVDDISPQEETDLRLRLRDLRKRDDPVVYEIVVVRSFEDALMAVTINPNIQSCIIRYTFPYAAPQRLEFLSEIYTVLEADPRVWGAQLATDRSLTLGRGLKALRPELDLFLETDAPVEHVVGASSHHFRRVFYHQENYLDLHLGILKGIHERYDTPFFNALRHYSLKPTGVFHALPISRGNSIVRSHWIQDMGKFYGSNIFQAETSATTGGLDSLLQPHGPLKRSQELAARAFGARQTYFVTNGTSTANKIVLQALIRPGDIVLVAHDCHKSHHYAVLLAGARPIYLDAYPLQPYSMYGAVPLADIKRHLIHLKQAGKLDRVKMLLLTNITFDGVTYDPERIMEEVLAIKPDMVFVWDEAWFAYGRFVPTLRNRTAMWAADRLRRRYKSPEYRTRYREWKAAFDELDPNDDTTWVERRLLPDPDQVRIRTYATQSTHKTLTALRQGSMIHVFDQDFEQVVLNVFNEAYMTHTSTSPNYQILASLDVGRRQVELEGYEFVQRSVELAMTLRERVHADPLLHRYFRVLGPADMVPEMYRPSGLQYFYDPKSGWQRMEQAWQSDEFVLDPTRVTLDVGRTGMDGDSFKQLLMDRFDIQINKTSRNTVLFMIHIGMTRGMVAHLVKVLSQIAEDLNERRDLQSAVERLMHQRRVKSLTEDLPPLPNFSRFHRAFLPTPDSTTPEGNMREAFFLAYDDRACEYMKLDGTLHAAIESGREVVSATFVTPYPPGFPVLVPGQVITPDILEYLSALDVKEIHGYEPNYGFRVFTESALTGAAPARKRVSKPQARLTGVKA